jgi:phosphate transport system substrate-binding protein
MRSEAVKPLLTFAALTLALPALAQEQPQTTPPAQAGQSENAKRSIWTLNVTDFRKVNANKGGYTKKWDLSDLPNYKPRQQVSGKLRIWGSNYLKDGPLGEYWASEFRKYHPGVTIEYNLPTAGIAVPGVAGKVADLGVGRPATLMDHLTFEQVYKYPITEITAATGSYDVYGWSPGFIILVHKDNPISQIGMKQLDGVFGTARNGGYDGSVYRNDYPFKRGPEENIRTWGQLGLTGEWANKPIHPCGQSPRANIQVVFQNLVLRGSDQWVEGYQAFANYATPEGTINSWSKQVLTYAESDPLAICIASPLALGPKLKELAVQGFDGGPFVKRTLESVRDRSYPLINEIFFYANKAPGQRMDPKVEEFLRFVLSQQGQEQIQREGRYTPLTAPVVKAQLAKLEAGAK